MEAYFYFLQYSSAKAKVQQKIKGGSIKMNH